MPQTFALPAPSYRPDTVTLWALTPVSDSWSQIQDSKGLLWHGAQVVIHTGGYWSHIHQPDTYLLTNMPTTSQTAAL